ncbi:retrovirus-related pol polyprotein from transposon TNT 1-94 [Tanacetum coccineum]
MAGPTPPALFQNPLYLHLSDGPSSLAAASDHMTPIHDLVFDPYLLKIKTQIKLHNGDTSMTSHVGKVKLNNGLLLKDVLADLTTIKVRGVDKIKAGLYHLVNVPSDKIDTMFTNMVHSTMQKFAFSVVNKDVSNSYALWHHKLVDDCIRGTWVHLLEKNSDSFEALKSFIKFVSTQFEKQVKIVRSDNALKFVKGQRGPYLDFVSSVLVQKDPMNFKEAISNSSWCTAIDADLKALENNGTWELTHLPPDKKFIGLHWIFKTKLKADGTVDKKKSRLVMQGNRQKYRMDVSNAFLHGDFLKEVYMKPPLGYVGQGKSITVEKLLDQVLFSKTNYSLFVKKQDANFTAALVYVDDLLGIFLSQHKYTTELLKEGGVLNNKPYKLPIDPNLKVEADVGNPLTYLKDNRRSIRKLIYLTVTRHDICYTVQLLSQFMQSPTSVNMQAVKHLLRYLLKITRIGYIVGQ